MLRIRGSASNMPNGTVKVLLDTDDMDLVSRYKNAIRTNPRGERFYGSIQSIDVSSYQGSIYGDYTF
jgi:acylphosphatase